MITLRPVSGADVAWLEPAFEAYLNEIAPGVTGLSKHPPLTQAQSMSYRFNMQEGTA